MTVSGVIMLAAVMLLSPEDEAFDAAEKARFLAEADAGITSQQEARKSLRITSVSGDFDRQSGVAMFENDVLVDYSEGYKLRSDKLYVFMKGSNTLSRIVALGNVALTNETRVGVCGAAIFWHTTKKIEMYSKGELTATLDDLESGDSVAGDKITFWLDTEQVFVEKSKIKFEQKGDVKIL